MKKREIPRPLSYVYFDFGKMRKKDQEAYPFRHKEWLPYIFLGEIPNMPGHCIVLDPSTHEIYDGYHTDDFKEYKEDEV